MFVAVKKFLKLVYGVSLVGGINPKKECNCQEGLLVVNWAQIHNQSVAAIVYRDAH